MLRILFYGSPDYTAAFLDALSAGAEIAGVVTAADKKSGRGQITHRPAPASWAEKRSIPLFQAPDLRGAHFTEQIRELKPDLGVIVAYGRILPRAVFALPPLETINVHFSLLPEYRGASPIESALLSGAQRSGVSVQRIAEELDAGDVLASAEVTVDQGDHYPELFAKLMEAGLALLPRCIEILETGGARYTPQDAEKATFCGKIDTGARRIDWNNDAKRVYNQIRAYSGARTAWTTIRGKKILLHRARPMAEEEQSGAENTAAAAGQIVPRGGKVFVSCGDGRYVSPAEVQLENKRRVPAAECLNGLRLQPGECFL